MFRLPAAALLTCGLLAATSAATAQQESPAVKHLKDENALLPD